MNWIAAGCASGFLSVALGAFGAHALKERLTGNAGEIWRTAVQYQMFHSTALILFGLWLVSNPGSNAYTGWSFLAGVLLFSGSLYALALTDVKILGAITPLGGLLFLAGWILFGLQAWKGSR